MESALRDGAGQPGLKLIETMLWDGARFPRLAWHLARLETSAARLGWPGLPQIEARLPALPEMPMRLRLTLDRAGELSVETVALPPPKPLWCVALSDERLQSTDPWLSVKTTNRARYDRARAALPPGLDEWLFANERGEVCEGTITSIVFDRGQGMRTPPLSCGLLPGVLRAELALREEVLPLAELPDVRLWVGNALRGLIPAKVVGAPPAPARLT